MAPNAIGRDAELAEGEVLDTVSVRQPSGGHRALAAFDPGLLARCWRRRSSWRPWPRASQWSHQARR